MFTKRIFDGVIILSLSLHLAWNGLVKPFGVRWATQHRGARQVVGETLARAA